MDVSSLTKRAFGCVFLAGAACSDTAPGAAESATTQAGNAATTVPPQAGMGMQSAASGSGGRAGSSSTMRPPTRSGTDAAGRAGANMTGAAGTSGAGGATGPSVAGQAGASQAGAGAGAAGQQAAAGSAGAAANSGKCELPDPPADIAEWVNESWNDQLGMNVKSRKAWNLDHVMLNQGYLNLCVRWGATMAVPASVRDNLAATTERWFNDWFKGLAGYGCFPYGDGIKVKITGWAVRPGKQALLDGVDKSIPIYTEVDAEGEPKCPDACSSFEHWDHKFDGCKGGDENHTDYWLWFDDTLPGAGGAAAVGGDWGLRMPVSTFLDAFDQPSFHITEHEMGHGFGFQDYYDWKGAKPNGGSIMIVGSTNSASPTAADHWLLKRTWKELKTLRGW